VTINGKAAREIQKDHENPAFAGRFSDENPPSRIGFSLKASPYQFFASGA
jgi:hypothetical protein